MFDFGPEWWERQTVKIWLNDKLGTILYHERIASSLDARQLYSESEYGISIEPWDSPVKTFYPWHMINKIESSSEEVDEPEDNRS